MQPWFRTEETGFFQFDRATGREVARHRVVRGRPLGGFATLLDRDFDEDRYDVGLSFDPTTFDQPCRSYDEFFTETWAARKKRRVAERAAKVQADFEEAERQKQIERERIAEEQWTAPDNAEDRWPQIVAVVTRKKRPSLNWCMDHLNGYGPALRAVSHMIPAKTRDWLNDNGFM